MDDLVVTSSEGIRLAVRDHGGKGPDVLFLHGRSRSLADWSSVLAHLADIRAVSMDLRWHGRSDVGGSVSIDALIADIEAVVDALVLRRPLLVGHSMGGVIASYYAAGRPAHAGVVNIDGLDARMLNDQDEPELVRQMSSSSPPIHRNTVDHGDETWLRMEIASLRRADDAFGVPEGVTNSMIERVFVRDDDGTWHRRPPTAFYELGLGRDTEPLTTALERAACPVLVLLCTGEPKTPSERDRAMSATRAAMLRNLGPLAVKRPNIQVRRIDGSHAVIWEKPAEVASIVRSLL